MSKTEWGVRSTVQDTGRLVVVVTEMESESLAHAVARSVATRNGRPASVVTREVPDWTAVRQYRPAIEDQSDVHIGQSIVE